MPHQIIASSAAVATGHPYGAAAGLEMLRDGGNAIDAAVAAMIALSVVIPSSVGFGGYGGSAVVCKGPRVVAVDFDSCAPRAFRGGLVTADPDSNYYSARSVTVPAVVGGLELILRQFGTKSWREVSQPAIRLAEEGIEFDTEHERHLDRCAPKFDKQSLENLFPGGTLPRAGDRWCQPDLARLLHRLVDDGPQSFYEGDIAEQIVRYLHDRGGILNEEDFRSYHPRMVESIHATCCGYQLYTAPPPSGGLTSLAIVQTIDQIIAANQIEPWSAQYFHVLAEATKLCWRERNEHLADPDFINIPMERLLSEETARERTQQVNLRGTIGTRPNASRADSPHTANVIAADAEGNLISLTATQGWMYGSHLVVDDMGLVLNHGMSRFDYSPGHANAPAPGKRMQHNMAPMIAQRDGQPAFAYGLPGGPKIVSVTAQLVLDTIAFGATPAASIAAPRLHTQGDEPVLASAHIPDSIVAALEEFGHTIRREADMGGPVNVLTVNPQSRQIDIASGESTGAVAGF